MISQEVIEKLVDALVVFATDALLPLMVVAFTIGVLMRFLVYLTLKRQEQFSIEFEKRKNRYLDEKEFDASFYMATKKVLVKTFYEMFVTQALLQRRKADPVMSWGDRVFLIRSGFAWLVKDVLRQIRYLKYDGNHPKLLEISKNTYQHNPFFNNVFGRINSRLTTDLLNILPSMFIIGGIFGTFLGIMKALPDLGGLNPEDAEASKLVLDAFLLKISFAMSTSIVGILLSVLMTVVNVTFSPTKIFLRTVERFENTLNAIWAASTSNEIPAEGEYFDEHKNPLEALAEAALDKEVASLAKTANGREFGLADQDKAGKAS